MQEETRPVVTSGLTLTLLEVAIETETLSHRFGDSLSRFLLVTNRDRSSFLILKLTTKKASSEKTEI